MITIHIDGRQVEAESGASIIEVADRIGISIPRFCYHPGLSVAASCRMCLVEVSTAPKPVPACATPVTDGMQVFTKSAITQQTQKTVTELLLINHPLDCPVCDQAGECELQDLIMRHSKDRSAFKEEKRQVPNPNLGPLVATEMNRCIHCTRCVRFGDEVAGYPEMGGAFRGENLKITNYLETALQSEVSGNMIDICPVGALTSKPHRFGGRTWSFRSYPGWIGHDGFRSPIQWHVDKGALKRIVYRQTENENFYGPWISDRDRFGYLGLFAQDRLKEIAFIKKNHYQKSSVAKIQQLLDELLPNAQSWGAMIHPQAALQEAAAINLCLEKAPQSLGMALLTEAIPLAGWDNFEKLISTQNPKIVLGSFASTDHPIESLQIRQWAEKGGHLECWSFIEGDRFYIKGRRNCNFAAKSLSQTKQLLKKRVAELIQSYGEYSCDLIVPQSSLSHPWFEEILASLSKIVSARCLWYRHPQWPGVNPSSPSLNSAPDLLFISQAETADWASFAWAKNWVEQAKLIIILGAFFEVSWLKSTQIVICLPSAVMAERHATYPAQDGLSVYQSAKAIEPPGESKPAEEWLQQLFHIETLTAEHLLSWRKYSWVQAATERLCDHEKDSDQPLWVLKAPLNLDPIVRRSIPLQQTPWALRAQGFWVGPEVLPSWAPDSGESLTVVDNKGHECSMPYQVHRGLPKKTIICWDSGNNNAGAMSCSWVKIEQGVGSC